MTYGIKSADWLLEFLVKLELAIPPPRDVHHIIFCTPCSDGSDWKDELMLQLTTAKGKKIYFLKNSDFLLDVDSLVAKLASEVNNYDTE